MTSFVLILAYLCEEDRRHFFLISGDINGILWQRMRLMSPRLMSPGMRNEDATNYCNAGSRSARTPVCVDFI